jgi:hypothetical protein
MVSPFVNELMINTLTILLLFCTKVNRKAGKNCKIKNRKKFAKTIAKTEKVCYNTED